MLPFPSQIDKQNFCDRSGVLKKYPVDSKPTYLQVWPQPLGNFPSCQDTMEFIEHCSWTKDFVD